MHLRVLARLVALSLTLSAAILHAQPRIEQLQNNYSYLLPGNPNYGIAQGSIFIIKGSNLANTTTALQNVPLQTTLNGVSAKVTVNGTTRDIIWYYVTPNQLGGILPSSTPVGAGTLTVTNSTGTSAPAAIQVVQSAFGTLTLDGSGVGNAAVYDLNYSFLSATNSAKPGDTILLFGTGAGPVAADETVTQTPVNLSAVPIVVEIGGVPATVQYHGRTTFPGLDQINVVVPSGIAFGCAVPLSVKSGQYGSNVTTIPVAANGGTCPAPSGGSSEGTAITQAEVDSWIAAGQYRIGSIGLTRQWSYAITDNVLGGAPTTSLTKSDALTAGFTRISGSDLRNLLTSQVAPPAAGQCTVTTGIPTNPYPNLTYAWLDAGASIGVSGPAGSRSAPRTNAQGVIGYSATIGPADPGNYLDAGRYTFTGPGGPDVGAFSGSINVAPDLQWTNRANVTIVDRTQSLTVQWTGGEPTTLVTVQGTSTVIQGTSVNVASFTCYGRNTDRQLTVPASILSQIPASARLSAGGINLLQRGSLAIASVGVGARFTASGVDYLTGGNQWGIAQSTEYK